MARHGRGAQRRGRSAPARSQHGPDDALAGVEQREQQVLGLDRPGCRAPRRRGPRRRGPPGRARWACRRPSDGPPHRPSTLVDHAAVASAPGRPAARRRRHELPARGVRPPPARARCGPRPRRARPRRSRARRSARSRPLLQLEHALDAGQVEALLRELLDAAEQQPRRPRSRPACCAPCAAGVIRPRRSYTRSVCGCMPGQLGGDADQEEAGGAAGAHENRRSRGFAPVEGGEGSPGPRAGRRRGRCGTSTRSARDQVAAPGALQARARPCRECAAGGRPGCPPAPSA